jgi:chorismate synthase
VIPVIEAMVKIVLADHFLRLKTLTAFHGAAWGDSSASL